MLIHISSKFISIAALVGVQLFFLGISSSMALAGDLSDRQPKSGNATQPSRGGSGYYTSRQAQKESLPDEHPHADGDTQSLVDSATQLQQTEQDLDPKDDGVYHPPLNLGYPDETMSSGTR